jgi:hypothetical protein
MRTRVLVLPLAVVVLVLTSPRLSFAISGLTYEVDLLAAVYTDLRDTVSGNDVKRYEDSVFVPITNAIGNTLNSHAQGQDPTGPGGTVIHDFVLGDSQISVVGTPVQNGSLRATASAVAQALDNGTALDWENVAALSQGVIRWADMMEITSPTLPVGTPVEFLISIDLSANITGSHVSSSAFAANTSLFGGCGTTTGVCGTIANRGNLGIAGRAVATWDGWPIPFSVVNDYKQGGDPFQALTTRATAHVGDVLPLGASLLVVAGASTTTLPSPPAALPGQSSMFITVNAGHTANFFVDPITPGVSYFTTSGLDYRTPSAVPESSTLMLIGIAIVGLTVWRSLNPSTR